YFGMINYLDLAGGVLLLLWKMNLPLDLGREFSWIPWIYDLCQSLFIIVHKGHFSCFILNFWKNLANLIIVTALAW
ncbi:hypothetical protein ACJX0J_026063, partial [Zea mays]